MKTTNRNMNVIKVILLLTFLATVAGCGSGGGGGAESSAVETGGTGTPTVPAARMLNWDPPSAYQDNSPLNPTADLDSFEIYVSADGTFGEGDIPAAVVSAVEGGGQNVTTSFNLSSLAGALNPGTTYYVSVRALARNGLRSDFSPQATFSL